MYSLILVVVHLTSSLTAATANRCTKHTQSTFGHRLRNRLIEKAFENDLFECFRRCQEHGKCYSTNYDTVEKICELNNGNSEVFSEQFEKDDRFIYMDNPDMTKIIQSCLDHKMADPSASSGMYNIGPANRSQVVYCDMSNPDYEYLDIEVKAFGFSDASRAENGDIFSSSYLQVNGKKFKAIGRGHTFLSLNPNGIPVSSVMSFDTHHDYYSISKMAEYINGLPNNTIVMLAVIDTGGNYASINQIKSLGAIDPSLKLRQSYALIGHKGDPKPAWIREVKKGNGDGPSIATARIKMVLKRV